MPVRSRILERRLTDSTGSGQIWWDAFQDNETVHRPLLFGTEGLKGGSMSGINMKNSPMWFNIISDTTDFVISDLKIWNEDTNAEAPPKVCYLWPTFFVVVEVILS